MKVKILAILIAVFGCGLAATMMSCNGDGVADAPNQPTRGGKNQRELNAGCNSTLAVERCAGGQASTSYDEFTGVLSVSGSNDTKSGVKSTFNEAHNWHQEIETDIPDAAAEQISAVAYNGETRQARLDINDGGADNSAAALMPTFDAGAGNYDIEVYNDGALVGSQASVAAGSTTHAALKIRIRIRIGFIVITIDFAQQAGVGDTQAGACAWVLGSSSDAAVDITLPDGSVVQGDEVRFIENVTGDGRYPYHGVTRVDVLSSMGSFDILSEHATN